MEIYCGIDFGTTNTVVSISSRDGKLIDSFSIPTTLFIPFENQGISKVYIGENARTEYESGNAGRFIHSIKRSLSDRYLHHTTINRTYVKLEDLICLFLIELKEIIFDKWCLKPVNIVLGRPVKFSVDKSENKLANERLINGFKLAGFKKIVQLEEPVAASLCFEDFLSKDDRRFLIIDLGGGTSDFSLVHRDPMMEGIARYTIKSIDGINIGGDNFDEDIMFSRLSPELGINATFESFDKRLPMPTHIYKDVSKWNSLHLFDKKQMADDFNDYLYKSDNPIAIHRLRAIIENKLSHKLLDQIRLSKHNLRNKSSTRIIFNEYDIGINAFFEQRDFAEIISSKVRTIINVMNQTVGGEHQYVNTDKIILTGGSSRVKIISDTVADLTGSDKVLMDSNFFDSVSKGLSLYAYYKNISIN